MCTCLLLSIGGSIVVGRLIVVNDDPIPAYMMCHQADEGFDAVEQVAGLTPGPFRHQREHHLFFSLLTK